MKRLGKSTKPPPRMVVQANTMFFSVQRQTKNQERLREAHAKLLQDYPDSFSWDEWTYEGWEKRAGAAEWQFERYSHQTPELWDMLDSVATWYCDRDTTAELTYTREDARYKYRLHIYMTKPFSFSAREARPGRLLLCSDWCAQFTLTPLVIDEKTVVSPEIV